MVTLADGVNINNFVSVCLNLLGKIVYRAVKYCLGKTGDQTKCHIGFNVMTGPLPTSAQQK